MTAWTEIWWWLLFVGVSFAVALTQDTPGKTPIAAVIAPVVPALLP